MRVDKGQVHITVWNTPVQYHAVLAPFTLALTTGSASVYAYVTAGELAQLANEFAAMADKQTQEQGSGNA